MHYKLPSRPFLITLTASTLSVPLTNMLTGIQMDAAESSYIDFLVSSNIGIFLRTFGSEEAERKRRLQTNKPVDVEIWRTLWSKDIFFFFGVYCVHVMLRMLPHCDILKTCWISWALPRLWGWSGECDYRLWIYLFSSVVFVFFSYHVSRELKLFRRQCENSSPNRPTVLSWSHLFQDALVWVWIVIETSFFQSP